MMAMRMTIAGAKRLGVRQPSAALGIVRSVAFSKIPAIPSRIGLWPSQSGVAAALCHRTPGRFAHGDVPAILRGVLVLLLITACAVHAQFPGAAWERLSDADS